MKGDAVEKLSDEFLNAFVDDQLESAEKNMAFDAIEADDALRERVCDLRSMKEMVQHAYHQVPANRHVQDRATQRWSPYAQSIAACFVLLAGVASGWFGHAFAVMDTEREITRLFQASQSNDFGEEPHKIIVQVSNSNFTRLKSALDMTEGLLESHKKENRQLQVEIVANSTGANLLRADITPFAKRLELLQARYPNLELVLCGQTLSKLQEQGVDVQLVRKAIVVPSAAQQIKQRLKQGWDYVRT